MFDAGEDPLYLGRRLVRMAVEDIGLADPQALVICNAAKDAYDYLGSPEGELEGRRPAPILPPRRNPMLSTRPINPRCGRPRNTARCCRRSISSTHRPSWAKDEGYGDGYRYDHDEPDAFSGQDYFPEKMGRRTFYDPPERGFERDLRKRLEWWS